MTVLRYICVCCDGKRGDGTLRRLRPHNVYVCQSCVKVHGGLSAIQDNLPVLITYFNARRQRLMPTVPG